jgi:integrase
MALRRRDADLLHGVLHVERASKEINSSAESMAGDKGLSFGPTKTHATRKLKPPGFLIPMIEAHLATSPATPTRCCSRARPGSRSGHNLSTSASSSPPSAPPSPRRYTRSAAMTSAALSLAVAPNLHVVKERLGHDDIRKTVNIYGHLLPSADDALAAGLDGWPDPSWLMQVV